jgi:hypothetical protein
MTLFADYTALGEAADRLIAGVGRPDLEAYARSAVQLPQTLRDLIETGSVWPIDETGLHQVMMLRMESEAAAVNSSADGALRAPRRIDVGQLPRVRPTVPAAVRGTLGFMGHASLARAALEWARRQGIRIDVDHPLELMRNGKAVGWPLVDWLFDEMERRTGFHSTAMFIMQQWAANNGERADWSQTYLPLYSREIFDAAMPLLEFVERAMLVHHGKAALGTLHLPELVSVALGRRQPQGGKTLAEVFGIQERVGRIDAELQRIVADQDASSLPPPWRAVFEAVFASNPHLVPRLIASRYEVQQYPLDTAERIEEYVRMAAALADVRFALDEMILPCLKARATCSGPMAAQLLVELAEQIERRLGPAQRTNHGASRFLLGSDSIAQPAQGPAGAGQAAAGPAQSVGRGAGGPARPGAGEAAEAAAVGGCDGGLHLPVAVGPRRQRAAADHLGRGRREDLLGKPSGRRRRRGGARSARGRGAA